VSGSESNSTVLFFPVIAALVGMALGFVTIWSQIRSQSRQAKQESEAARADLERRIRDYLDLRLTNMQMSVDHLKESVARVERKLNNNQHQQKEENG
jgi:Tfp pilus assembly protein PilO